MTTQQKLVQKKLTLLELGEYLQNVSEACRISGCSRQHFYDIKKAYESQGLEGLKEKTRRKPCVKNRVAPTNSFGGESGDVSFLSPFSLQPLPKSLIRQVGQDEMLKPTRNALPSRPCHRE